MTLDIGPRHPNTKLSGRNLTPPPMHCLSKDVPLACHKPPRPWKSDVALPPTPTTHARNVRSLMHESSSVRSYSAEAGRDGRSACITGSTLSIPLRMLGPRPVHSGSQAKQAPLR